MIYDLEWAGAIAEDLANVRMASEDQWATCEAFFDLLEEDDELLLSLASDRFLHLDDPHFDVTPVIQARDLGIEVCRIKLFDEADDHRLDYRILYSVDHSPPRGRIVILAVAHRDVAYKIGNELWERINHDHSCFGLPRSRGHH